MSKSPVWEWLNSTLKFRRNAEIAILVFLYKSVCYSVIHYLLKFVIVVLNTPVYFNMARSKSKWIMCIKHFPDVLGDDITGLFRALIQKNKRVTAFEAYTFSVGLRLLKHRTKYYLQNKNSTKIRINEKKKEFIYFGSERFICFIICILTYRKTDQKQTDCRISRHTWQIFRDLQENKENNCWIYIFLTSVINAGYGLRCSTWLRWSCTLFQLISVFIRTHMGYKVYRDS